MFRTYVKMPHRLYTVDECEVKDLKQDIDYCLAHGNIFMGIGNGRGWIDWINIYHIIAMWDEPVNEE